MFHTNAAPIAHLSADCPGLWTLDGEYIHCPACEARWLFSNGRQRAAENENFAGFVLANLTRQGRKFIA